MLSRVLGAVVIIVGLYLVVWGKNKDENCSSSEDLKLPTKQILEDNKTMETLTIEPNSCIDLKNNNEQKWLMRLIIGKKKKKILMKLF